MLLAAAFLSFLMPRAALAADLVEDWNDLAKWQPRGDARIEPAGQLLLRRSPSVTSVYRTDFALETPESYKLSVLAKVDSYTAGAENLGVKVSGGMRRLMFQRRSDGFYAITSASGGAWVQVHPTSEYTGWGEYEFTVTKGEVSLRTRRWPNGIWDRPTTWTLPQYGAEQRVEVWVKGTSGDAHVERLTLSDLAAVVSVTPAAPGPNAPAMAPGCAEPWWRSFYRGRGNDSTWMADNYDRLCELSLREIAIPGSHDTGTYGTVSLYNQRTDFSNPNTVFAPDQSDVKRLLSFSGPLFIGWSQNQERAAYQQLSDGIRYFDLRVCVDGSDRLLTCHGLYGASIDSILDDVRRFADQHSGEIILLGFNHFWDGAWQRQNNVAPGEREGMRPEMWQKLVSTITTSLTGKLASGNTFTPDSRLEDLASAGSSASTNQVIVLFDTEMMNYPDDASIWNQKERGTWKSGWDRNAYLQGLDETLRAAGSDGKFWAVRSCVTHDAELIGKGMDLTGSYPRTLADLADQTNPVVLGWLKDTWRGNRSARERPVNLIWADFYNRTELVKLAKHLNGIPVSWAGTSLDKDTAWGSWKVGAAAPIVATAQSYGRGVGEPLGCGPNEDKDGALCYPRCKSGYTGVGPVCWEKCPSGYADTGGHCAKPAPYGRGAGYPWKFGDALNDSGMFARCEASQGSSNCEKWGAVVYPKCRSGFHAAGCCVCSPDCPSGMTDIGVSCQKRSYGRTAGTPLHACREGQERNGLLCYPRCKEGYTGKGPVCWPQQP